jgi:hypothetical protein
MQGFIVLRNIPKREVNIDLFAYPIEGGFRGFQIVPIGKHYISVETEDIHAGVWCDVEEKTPVVKVLNEIEGRFEDDTPESAAHFQRLALSGAMAHALIPYPLEAWETWEKLVNHINAQESFPVLYRNEINQLGESQPTEQNTDGENSQNLSAFEEILDQLHKGDISAFLAEFQFAFISWIVAAEGEENTEAADRYRYLLETIYNVSPDKIKLVPQFFIQFIDTFVSQLDTFPDDIFTDDNLVTQDVECLIGNLLNSDEEAVRNQGIMFAQYMRERGMRSLIL